MTPWGVYDMGGNVREWCVNADGEGKRYTLGGGWSDLSYMFTDSYAQQPLDRSPINGIRLIRRLATTPNLAQALEPIRRTLRDFSREKPVSDAAFANFRELFAYDRTALNARIEKQDSTPAEWIRQKVSFDAAYGRERVVGVLYLPKAHEGPDETVAYRDHVLAWAKDLRRSVDYLSTRPDIDSTRIAFAGVSWGGAVGGLMMAIEPRFRAGILYVAGLKMEKTRPEVDVINFLPHVRIPVIMLNAKYDHFFPPEATQKPYFRLLGTAPADKKFVLYESGHFLLRSEMIGESLAWLDHYLGPVTR